MYRISPEVVVLPLLTVGNDGRPGRLEALDRILDRGLVLRVLVRVRDSALGYGLDQRRWSGDAADWLGREGHRHSFIASCRPAPRASPTASSGRADRQDS